MYLRCNFIFYCPFSDSYIFLQVLGLHIIDNTIEDHLDSKWQYRARSDSLTLVSLFFIPLYLDF